MIQPAIKETITLLKEALASISHEPIVDDKEYKEHIDLHELLRQTASITSEMDQLVIDKMDGYDAQKFKEALGL